MFHGESSNSDQELSGKRRGGLFQVEGACVRDRRGLKHLALYTSPPVAAFIMELDVHLQTRQDSGYGG